MTPAAADAGGMWRVSFLLGAAPPLDVLEALEAEAASVSIFEDAVDAEQRPTRWRVDMLLEREPERSSMRRTLERLLARWNLEARDVDLRFLAHEDWLARASMPRETLRVGRFVVHGADRAADAGAGEVGLRVELGMAFGSGEHESTRGCLMALDRLLRPHRRIGRVLDLGCGSAILAIAVAKAGSGAARLDVVAGDVDPVAVAAMAERFGLGHELGIDVPGERPGLIPTRAWKKAAVGESWQKGETLVAGIGQGFVLATPLQLAIMTARLCNGGMAVRPWLVEPEAGALAGIEPIGVSPQALRAVQAGMHEVINGRRGTARKARLDIEGVEMAGKTGTSQVRRISRTERAAGAHKRKDRPWEERDHALFVCYAPYDAPRYAVSVIVEHGQSGSGTASPIARDIMTRALELDPSHSRTLARV